MSRMYPDPPCSFFGLEGDVKLREEILYVSEKCANDPGFGSTKLNKILNKADMRAYALYGAPISGVEYMALDNGPAPRRLVPIRTSMLEAHEIVEQERPVGGYIQRRIVPLRAPDFSRLSAQDIAIIDAVIEEMWEKGGARVSDESHGRSWRIAHKAGVAIPYAAAFLCDDEVARAADNARARELAEEFGWKR
jgi:hypothetical protein